MHTAAAGEPYNEDGLDSKDEDVACTALNHVPHDNGLFNALPPIQQPPPPAPDAVTREDLVEIRTELAAMRTAIDGTNTRVSEIGQHVGGIRQDVTQTRTTVNSSNRVLIRVANRLDGTFEARRKSQEDATQTCKDAEAKIKTTRGDTDWARRHELKAYRRENSRLRSNNKHLAREPQRYIKEKDYTERLRVFVQDSDKMEAMCEEEDTNNAELKAQLEKERKKNRAWEAAERRRVEEAERRKRKREAATGEYGYVELMQTSRLESKTTEARQACKAPVKARVAIRFAVREPAHKEDVKNGQILGA
ncbi:hypothetical protein FN846DRAFT_903488 [Sphaerosporella brunnea]|uniref:Uncharacterized protein n=1 Tax=Sphaerosporella brunnea TaxID=1250544 RepID=A0A5J5F6F9_9PEZI|nr:hypothetical protein FN846DRAFT_903488 [Sphaerosporella brunnea]